METVCHRETTSRRLLSAAESLLVIVMLLTFGTVGLSWVLPLLYRETDGVQFAYRVSGTLKPLNINDVPDTCLVDIFATFEPVTFAGGHVTRYHRRTWWWGGGQCAEGEIVNVSHGPPEHWRAEYATKHARQAAYDAVRYPTKEMR